MTELISNTGERTIPEKWRETKEGYLLLLRLQFAYEYALTKIPDNSYVLEVGCGDGYGTRMLSEKTKKIIGIDVDKQAIEEAKNKYGTDKCVFQVYDGQELPYSNDTFDAIASFQVIEHVNDDKGFVSEINRVLKKGGIFMVTTPNKTYRLKKGQKPFNPFHVREYYPEELEELLRTAFKNVEMCGIRGTEVVQKIEVSRVQNPGLNRIINLRKIVPEPLKPFAIKLIKIIKKTNPKRDFLEKFKTSDYYVIKDNLSESLDLLGICRK